METDTRMTDQQRDPEADGPEGAADPDLAADAAPGADDTDMTDAELDERDELDADEADDQDEDQVAEAPVATRPGGAASTPAQRKGKAPAARLASTPTLADEAVHVGDRVSTYFVIGTVGLFVLILLWALVWGQNGLIADALATPRPARTPVVTIAPSTIPSVAPSSSGSAGPSGSASAVPSAGASAAPSSPASNAPSVAPSASPASPAPSAS